MRSVGIYCPMKAYCLVVALGVSLVLLPARAHGFVVSVPRKGVPT
jgi:hypothetical protein